QGETGQFAMMAHDDLDPTDCRMAQDAEQQYSVYYENQPSGEWILAFTETTGADGTATLDAVVGAPMQVRIDRLCMGPGCSDPTAIDVEYVGAPIALAGVVYRDNVAASDVISVTAWICPDR